MPAGAELQREPSLPSRVVIACIRRYLHQVGMGFHHCPEADMGMPRGGRSSSPMEWRCTMGCKLAARDAAGRCLFPWRPGPEGDCSHSVLEAYWFAAANLDLINCGDEAAPWGGWGCRRANLRGIMQSLYPIPADTVLADGDPRRVYRAGMDWLSRELWRCSATDQSFLAWLQRGRW